jgi:hypothetical protein
MEYAEQYRQWAKAKHKHEEQKRREKTSRVLGFLCLLALGWYFFGALRSTGENKIKKPVVRVVKGTVLTAEMVVEPGSVSTGEVVVAYEQTAGKTVTRSFYLDSNTTPETIPRPGDTVLVSWNVERPDDAYLMPVEYSPPHFKND